MSTPRGQEARRGERNLPSTMPTPRAAQIILAAAVVIGAVSLYLIALRRRRAEIWGLGEVAGTLLGVVALALFLGFLLEPGPELTLQDLVPIVVAQNAYFVTVVLYVVAVRYRLPLQRIGFTLRAPARMLVVGVALAVPIIAVSQYGGQWLTERGLIALEGPEAAQQTIEQAHEQDQVNQVIESVRDPRGLLTAAVLIALLAPLGEETFFRGMIYTGLRARWPAPAAVAASAVLFAFVHLQWVTFLPILLLGVALAVVYDRTRSLVPVMAIHGLNNLLALLSAYFHWGI